MTSADLELVYVGDPMCSWCWGFAPVLDGLQRAFDIPLRVVVGGLAPGGAASALDQDLGQTIAHHWHEVEDRSGQPFDHDALARRIETGDWRYDTELPCMAVAAVRACAPDRALDFMAHLHRAFYAEGRDITRLDLYRELAADFVPDLDAFMEDLGSETALQRAWQDFSWARQMGIGGFPTLLLRDGEDWAVVTRGWLPLDQIEPALRAWLEERHPQAVAGETCEPGAASC